MPPTSYARNISKIYFSKSIGMKAESNKPSGWSHSHNLMHEFLEGIPLAMFIYSFNEMISKLTYIVATYVGIVESDPHNCYQKICAGKKPIIKSTIMKGFRA